MSNKTKKKEKTYFENYDIYSDANPKDTIRVKYATIKDLTNTIKKLEKIFKNKDKPHNRISQIANIIKQRLRIIVKNTNKGKDRLELITRYFDFLKERTKKKTFEERKKLIFSF